MKKEYRLERKIPLKDTIRIVQQLGFFIKKQDSRRISFVKSFPTGRLHCTVSKHHKIPDRVIIKIHWDEMYGSGRYFIQPSEIAAKTFTKIHNGIQNEAKGAELIPSPLFYFHPRACREPKQYF
jgi:hypothetical protein